MKIEDVKKNVFSMPMVSPTANRIDYKFTNREYFIIDYQSEIETLGQFVPKPLKPTGLVKFEFMKMHDSNGFGSFNEAGQLIEVEYEGKRGLYSHIMLLDNLPSIAAGREIWGFPKKYAHPTLTVDSDTLLGSVKYNSVQVAFGTMGYKYNELDKEQIRKSLEETPNFLLKTIPHVNGRDVSICQLVRYHLKDVTVKGAWTGPADLQIFNHALAGLNHLPVKKILKGSHMIADVTLGFGEVVFDYLK
ncbi:acetoacetate decarboxylase [Allofrancisella guangzhouensis]|uniref:Acetoacetate decarboxylase n=1 Tax=Allofrancisella guangzhouensis TaxID=594679 RepID=A0A0A8E673_9GAMM|nr:acetoacetate decarboxylase [Allofrancisella guangzhouensis]AJC49062.1 acetoacetate decarboxylase [Allofrancisella guangzhouensis]MBK2026654.1 acetoacetate decarboxylase [Allofrancisella guangzhouensis]MBK2043867.1 acetoacetate decarboxylase [Allofrancisella guangzhouensis]MBK2046287.1 acetoacetate decarboxylase [Allofrancisella guangzhouensis]